MQTKEKEALFSEIYSGYKDRIYRICYGYIYEKEQVDDLFQEIMINIWNSLERFRGDSKIGTWIYKVAVNTALLYNKKNKFYGKLHFTIPETSETEMETDDFKIREEKLRMLANCISRLEKDDRIVISLILEELSYEQVSEITGITVSNVGVKVNRIKKKLFNMLKEMNYE
jgi:RNA polymerase sigma-70 factor (ECF subfamily)